MLYAHTSSIIVSIIIRISYYYYFYIWYMTVKEFDGEKIVDKHYHKGEQVYWDKFSSIHNKWFKFSGLVPQTDITQV